MQSLQKPVVRLVSNKIMEYDWGSSSQQCLIAVLTHHKCNKYAQLWMGTHKNGPSKLEDNSSLNDYLKRQNIQELPFMVKILCIEKALSLQLHPNKQDAERLFKQKPHIYQDDNQKPQMFLTLTQFECFFGIIDVEEWKKLCEKHPFSLLKEKDSFSLKKIIIELNSLSAETHKQMIEDLLKSIDQVLPERKEIILRLQHDYPFDVGILASCFLRYKKIPPGQCYGIAPGVPHTYISGSCLQIMKNSDNVVRMGLTPKLKDVETLVQILNDTIGLEGIRVAKSTEGYIWNELLIGELENTSAGHTEIDIPYQSIAIVFSKSFAVIAPEIKAERGTVLFFMPGKYVFDGEFKIILGSFVSK